MSSTDQDTGPAPFRLPELPPEMRRLILKEMTRIDGVSLTTLATVCREWAWIVEPVNWARIRVRERDLASLGYMTRRTWPMIRHVWFCIELDEYSCEYCDATIQAALPRQDGAHVHHTAHGSVIAALEGLWAGLSTWGEEGRVMLDLSIYSPSDSDHEYKYLTTLPDAPGEGFRDGRCTIDHVRPPPGVSDRGSWNAPFVPLPWYYPGEAQAPADHGWLSGRRVLPGSAWRLRRQFPLIDGLELPGDLDGDDGGDLLTDITERLPPVPAVKGVMLRQQDRRVWFPVLLGGPFARLPKLEELHYEPWRRYDRAEQRHEDDSKPLLPLCLSHNARQSANY